MEGMNYLLLKLNVKLSEDTISKTRLLDGINWAPIKISPINWATITRKRKHSQYLEKKPENLESVALENLESRRLQMLESRRLQMLESRKLQMLESHRLQILESRTRESKVLNSKILSLGQQIFQSKVF